MPYAFYDVRPAKHQDWAHQEATRLRACIALLHRLAMRTTESRHMTQQIGMSQLEVYTIYICLIVEATLKKNMSSSANSSIDTAGLHHAKY